MKKFNIGRRNFLKSGALLTAASATLNSFASHILPDTMEEKKVADHATTDHKKRTTAEILVERLIAWEVKFIFGLVGDGVNPIYEALRKQKDKIKLITVRHEESAAFMASGYAKYTGKLGVCIGTSGPGAVHLMNGLYDAAMEGAPVLAITGCPNHDLIGTRTTQEVNTVSLMKDVAVYNQMVSGPRHALTIVDLACRAALSSPGVAHLTFSKDTQQKQLSDDKASKESENLTGSTAFVKRFERPSEEELTKMAELLNSSNKIAILAGRGALGAGKELEELCRILAAPVAKALLGKMVISDDSPYTTGGIGHLGTLPSKEIMEKCEVLLILGSTMPYIAYYPKEGDVRTIQVDADPKRIGLRMPVDLGISADVRSTIIGLLPKLKQHDASFLNEAQKSVAKWKEKTRELEQKAVNPIKPQYLVNEVDKLLHNDSVVAIDTGAHTVFTARHLKARSEQQLAVCGNLASMAPGLPYILAAQLAYPNRQCVAFVGDGGFTMLMGEMATAVLYNLPVKIIVFKNNALAMDRFEQEEAGAEQYGIALQPIDFAGIAKACGAEGYSCKRAEDLGELLKTAFASAKPCVISVDVDPDEEPATPDKI